MGQEAAQALLTVCALAAAAELLTRDESGALAFRSVCALAVATAALRLAARLLGS